MRYADGRGDWLFFWDITDTAEYDGHPGARFRVDTSYRAPYETQ